MMVSPGPGNATTPRRPASPMQRSAIGMGAAGAAAAASPAFGRPAAGAGILESQQLRASTIAAPAPATAFAASAAPLGPGQPSSPMQATAQPAAAAVDPAVAAAAGYDVRRVSSPMMMNRYNSFQMQPGQMPAVGASMGVLTMLDGGSEEETIRNWVIMLDRLQGACRFGKREAAAKWGCSTGQEYHACIYCSHVINHMQGRAARWTPHPACTSNLNTYSHQAWTGRRPSRP